MKMYDYLISYICTQEGYITPSRGTIQVSRKKKIKTFEDINELNKLIADRMDGVSSLSIYHFILLGRNKH